MELTADERHEAVAIIESGLFDASWYITTYADVAAAPIEPLLHFMRYGWREGRDPGPLFSVSYYCAHSSDVADVGLNPLTHYLLYGWREGRRPRADFDPAAYVARFNLSPTVCPLIHEAARRHAAHTNGG